MTMTVRDLQIKQSRRMVTNFSRRHTRIHWRKDWDPTESTATRPLAFTDHTAATPATYFYTHDLTKNVCELLSRNGSAVEIVTEYDYTPFGAVTSSNSATPNTFMFSSEVLDAETSLIYYNYRHYNPVDGRWISRDPVEEKGGWNLYLFLRNRVINSSDRYGFFISVDSYIVDKITNPIVDFTQSIGVSVSNALNTVTESIKSSFREWDDKAKLKGTWKHDWRKKIKFLKYLSFQAGIGYKVSADSCCVKVSALGFGQIEGKFPIATIGVAGINFVVRGGINVDAWYKFCWSQGGERHYDGQWGWYVNGAMQAQFGVDIAILKADVTVELGASLSRHYSFRDGTWNELQIGVYGRVYAEWKLGWYNKRKELKVSYGDAPVV